MHGLNRGLTLLLALAVVAAGGLLVAETLAALLDRPPVVVDWRQGVARLETTTFEHPAARLAFAALAVSGLCLLVAELFPSRRTKVFLSREGSIECWLERRSLERYLADCVRALALVTHARVRLHPRRRRVDARVEIMGTREARGDVERTIDVTLERLGVALPRRISVVIRRLTRAA
ncbi:MAG: DUF6286 domain-containing protein [Vicinamibacteraceae bacterium]